MCSLIWESKPKYLLVMHRMRLGGHQGWGGSGCFYNSNEFRALEHFSLSCLIYVLLKMGLCHGEKSSNPNKTWNIHIDREKPETLSRGSERGSGSSFREWGLGVGGLFLRQRLRSGFSGWKEEVRRTKGECKKVLISKLNRVEFQRAFPPGIWKGGRRQLVHLLPCGS